MEKGLLFIPNGVLVFLKIMENAFKSTKTETRKIVQSDNMFESDKVNLLEYAARDETVAFDKKTENRPNSNLNTGKKTRRIELGMQNKNVLV